MSTERFFVTGASGCIGAWVVRNLVKEGVPTTSLDLDSSNRRLRLITTDEERSRVRFVQGDVTDISLVEAALRDSQASHVIHLAGLQLPFCKADPMLGARVNVVGTVNILEAAKRIGLQKVVYASSTAVYGLTQEYPVGPLAHEAPLKPRSHYGTYKQANEGTARVYWMDNGVSSIGLRPNVVYGPGRDQGMTSTPTLAMMAVAAGLPYEISFGGELGFQYADDIAKTFIQAARVQFEGADVFNIGGPTATVSDVIAYIDAAEPLQRGKIKFKDMPLPFPAQMDNSKLVALFGKLPYTPMAQAVAESITTFKRALAARQITEESLEQLLGMRTIAHPIT